MHIMKRIIRKDGSVVKGRVISTETKPSPYNNRRRIEVNTVETEDGEVIKSHKV